MFSRKFSEIFNKTYFVECIQTDDWMKLTKNIHRKISVSVSFLVQLETCGLSVFQRETPSQMLFCENCEVLQNIIFTEHYWATASDFL